MPKPDSTARMDVQVRLRDFLDDRWRNTCASAEVFTILPLAVVSLRVETFEDEGYDSPTIDYYLIIGPCYETQFPITMLVWVPDVSYSVIAEWDGYGMVMINDESHPPGGTLSDALFDGSEDVLTALLETTGGPLSIRTPVL
jgi:hypothetical protein